MAETLSEKTLRDIEEFDGVCTQRFEAMAAHLKDQRETMPEAEPEAVPARSTWPAWLETGSEEEKQRGILPIVNELAEILDRLWDEMFAAPLYAVD